MPPRLQWPAKDENGKDYPVAADDLKIVDADLLVNISPIVKISAGGPLNNFMPRVSIAIGVFDGKTKQFLGEKIVRLMSYNGKAEYSTYTSLEQDIKTAIPVLREALLSTVPEVVLTITEPTL